MSKAAGVVGLSAIGAAVSVGAVYLSRMGNFDSTLPEKLEDFEKENQLEGCVKSLFPSLESMQTTDKVDDKNKIADSFFDSENKNSVESCLVINWNKEVYSDGKWKGKFRFLWAVGDLKSKGFVVFALAEPASTGKKFTWKGAAYTLENDSQTKKWKTSKKLEMENHDKGKEVDYKDKFPKPKEATTLDWSFGDANGDNLCENGGCKDGTKKDETLFEGYWIWRGEAGDGAKNQLGEWTENLDAWWKEMFKEDNWKMSDVVKDMQGKWTNKFWYGKDKPS